MRKFVQFVPQESRLGEQLIDPLLVRRLQRNVEHPEVVTDLYIEADNGEDPLWLPVRHPFEAVCKALEIEAVPVAAKPAPNTSKK